MPRFRLPFTRRHRYRKHSNTRMILLTIFATAAILLFLPLYTIYKPPRFLINYFQSRWPDVIWQVPTTRKIIALTIDDAPTSYTAEIADILEAHNATATFFVIGSQVPGRKGILADLVRRGHELGNHAMYDEPSRSLTSEELLKQINQVQGYIAEAYEAAKIIQPTKRLFRPGSGFFSTRMREALAGIGYQIALGSVYPHDPQISYWRLNARHILSMVRPGAVIICHDRRSWTIPMLEEVLPKLRRRGYEIVSLSHLLEHTERG